MRRRGVWVQLVVRLGGVGGGGLAYPATLAALLADAGHVVAIGADLFAADAARCARFIGCELVRSASSVGGTTACAGKFATTLDG